MTTLRITQTKSTIGCKPNQRETIRSLGLKRLNHTVEHVDTPVVRGMLATVSHLVTVESAATTASAAGEETGRA